MDKSYKYVLCNWAYPSGKIVTNAPEEWHKAPPYKYSRVPNFTWQFTGNDDNSITCFINACNNCKSYVENK